jgi:hypothetical protein
MDQTRTTSARQEGAFPCPCCGFFTLGENPPGAYEICNLCGWEDDRVQFDNPFFRGGANRESLVECRHPGASRAAVRKGLER